VRVESPAQVSLFAYDNHTFIVESFLPDETDVKVAVAGGFTRLRNLVTGAATPGEMEAQGSGRFGGDVRMSFTVHLPPHSYAVFAAEK